MTDPQIEAPREPSAAHPDASAAHPDASAALREPSAAPRESSAALREPAHRVCPRAVTYWRVQAIITTVIVLGIALVIYFVVPARPWWATAIVALIALYGAAEIFAMPQIRFRIHRWEINDIAIHTREGWIGRESRIAPLSRVQTVDSEQGPLMRYFKLSSITVTTASAAGPITIAGLDQDDARELVVTLTEITAATEGDAT